MSFDVDTGPFHPELAAQGSRFGSEALKGQLVLGPAPMVKGGAVGPAMLQPHVIGAGPERMGNRLDRVAVMMVSAVFSFWSLRLFPGRGTLGFTAALLSVAAGSVVGPALAGFLATSLGPAVMFLVTAVPPLATALWFGAKLRRARPRLPPVSDPR